MIVKLIYRQPQTLLPSGSFSFDVTVDILQHDDRVIDDEATEIVSAIKERCRD